MPPDLTSALLEVLRLTLVMVTALFLPLLIQLSLLLLFGYAFFGLAVHTSYKLAHLLALVGTPIHEFSHAIAHLVTLGGVLAIKPLSDEVHVGFVMPSRGNNPIENILASFAPLFGGLTVLWLTGHYVIPDFEVPSVALPQFGIGTMTLGGVLAEILRFLASYFEATFLGLRHLPWGEWRTYVGLYIALSACMSLAASGADLRKFGRNLPPVLLLLVLVVGLVYSLGDASTWFERVQAGLLPRLLGFSTAVGMAFTLTFFGILLFLPLLLIQSLREKQPAAGRKKRSRR